MSGVLVDSNIIIDIITENATWYSWSANQIEQFGSQQQLYINPIIYFKISIPFQRFEEANAILSESYFVNLAFTQEVSFLAGEAFLLYRKNGDTKTLPLPEFFIGAQAAIHR